MYVFHNLKMIYIRVPRTGSTSFVMSMEKHAPQLTRAPVENHIINIPRHYSAAQAKRFIDPEIWSTYNKIGFVRHPYQWALSFRNLFRASETLFEHHKHETFRGFLKNLRLTPYDWFVDENGALLIDTIYKTEELREVLASYRVHHLHENKTSVFESMIELTSEEKRLIHQKFRREFEHYENQTWPL